MSSEPQLSSTRAARERRLALAGAVNFRDLGGYQTLDGLQTRWGTLYRSDSLAELSDDDLRQVEALGLRTLCDMRHQDERTRKPNRLPAGGRIRSHAIGFEPHGAYALFSRVRRRQIDPQEVHQALCEMYRRMPLEHAGTYAQLIDVLLQADALPALIHCTSGKDRTGFAAAVILLTLGVPRETIITDYVLTNQYRRDLAFLLGHEADPRVVDAAKRADPAFLDCAFASIDTHFGGEAGFIRDGLRLDAERQAQLRERLLETPL